MQFFARTCKSESMNFERLFARLFVVVGGLLWFIAALTAKFAYIPGGLPFSPWVTLAVVIVALAVGWFYEYIASALLLLGVVGWVIYGAVQGWGAGLWWTMAGIVIAPEFIAGLLFLLAARMQQICTLAERSAEVRPIGTMTDVPPRATA